MFATNVRNLGNSRGSLSSQAFHDLDGQFRTRVFRRIVREVLGDSFLRSGIDVNCLPEVIARVAKNPGP